jgi:hypothetical protein
LTHSSPLESLAREQRLAREALGAAVIAAIHEQRQRDMLQYAQALLPGLRGPHAGDLAPAVAYALARGHLLEANAVVADAAAVGGLQAGGDPQQRCLARATVTVDPDHLPARELQGDSVERQALGAGVSLADLLESQVHRGPA